MAQRICATIGWLTPVSEGGGEGGDEVEQLRRVQAGQVISSVTGSVQFDNANGLRRWMSVGAL